MNIYDFERAFGAADQTGDPMRLAIADWFDIYYASTPSQTENPHQRIAYTVVSKLSKAVFGEYKVKADDPCLRRWLRGLDAVRSKAVQLALIGGECYLKPCPTASGFDFTLIPRNNLLIFGRDLKGEPTDVGTVEQYRQDGYYYSLLERRTLDSRGYLTMENHLYRSKNPDSLGSEVSLALYPQPLAEKFTYQSPVDSVGILRMETPMVNCVDGSAEGVSVYAPVTELIRSINENEAQLAGEFRRGQSRILVSGDLLDEGQLRDDVFVALDEDPQNIGMTVFSPQLREQSYLARKQEYLRNVESITGLKRGMLSDANMDERTATEIAASNADFNLSVMELQTMWQRTVEKTVALCRWLAEVYGLEQPRSMEYAISWGNGVLFDETAGWEGDLTLVKEGLLKPELALGWRYGMATDTREELAAIREKLMP